MGESYGQQCFDIAQDLYPAAAENDIVDLLWSATCFPFGEPEQVRKNLEDALANTDGTPLSAMAYAEQQINEAMKALKNDS